MAGLVHSPGRGPVPTKVPVQPWAQAMALALSMALALTSLGLSSVFEFRAVCAQKPMSGNKAISLHMFFEFELV